MIAGQKDPVCSYKVTKHKEIQEQKKSVKKMNKKEQLKNQIKKDKELARIKFALITGV